MYCVRYVRSECEVVKSMEEKEAIHHWHLATGAASWLEAKLSFKSEPSDGIQKITSSLLIILHQHEHGSLKHLAWPSCAPSNGQRSEVCEVPLRSTFIHL